MSNVAKMEAIENAAKALVDAINANAPDCGSRNHAIAMIGDVLHCARYAIQLGDESNTPGVPA